jgi:hypothetical protein
MMRMGLVLCLGLVGCGDEFRGSCDCDPATEYCRIQYNDVVGEPHTRRCESLPDFCHLDVTCDCLAEDPCVEWGSCEVDDDGLITVGCPGG